MSPLLTTSTSSFLLVFKCDRVFLNFLENLPQLHQHPSAPFYLSVPNSFKCHLSSPSLLHFPFSSAHEFWCPPLPSKWNCSCQPAIAFALTGGLPTPSCQAIFILHFFDHAVPLDPDDSLFHLRHFFPWFLWYHTPLMCSASLKKPFLLGLRCI